MNFIILITKDLFQKINFLFVVQLPLQLFCFKILQSLLYILDVSSIQICLCLDVSR